MSKRNNLYSTDAEESVLTAALKSDEAFLQALKTLVPEDFVDLKTSLVFTAMSKAFDEGVSMDTITVMSKLNEIGRLQDVGSDYLGKLDNKKINTNNYNDYISIVKEYSRRRQIIETAHEAVAEVNQGKPSKEISEYLGSRLYKINSMEKRLEDESREYLAGALRIAYGGAFVPIGYPMIDRLCGGFPRGDLTFIGARSSHGKSAFIHSVTPGLVDWFRREQIELGEEPNAFIYVMTPDQHPELLWGLEAGRRCGISVSYLREVNGKGERLASDADIKLYDETLHSMFDEYSKSIRYRKGSITVEDVERETLAAIKAGAKMVVLDTIQRVSARGSLTDTVIRVSETLKNMSGDFNIPIVALSQIRREVDDRNPDDGDGRRPHVNDMSDAPRAMESDAGLILLLYQGSRYFPDNSAITPLEVNIAKNKSGKAGPWENNSVALSLQKEYAHISDPLNPISIYPGVGRVTLEEYGRLVNERSTVAV